MYLHKHPSRWTARAPAKLNLFLEVFDRRSDGFHELETLMVPIRLEDSLRLSAAAAPNDGRPGDINLSLRFAITPSGQEGSIASDDTNLVNRALQLLQERSGCRVGAHVELIKRIPVSAGLGGGSSDAAAALVLANRAWLLDWSLERLMELAAELGSDVPFFLAGGAAVCRGRGERVEKLRPMPVLHFVIVKPPDSLSTRDVYEAHAKSGIASSHERDEASGALAASVCNGRWTNLSAWMRNRLEPAAASIAPALRQIRSAFAGLDFMAHQLSGSGSAYFGVCRHAQHARRLATILRSQQLGLVYATRSSQ
jgi:4-diphosphocytidyl-2-C-methyl-D-erythritol kinase